MCMTSKIGIKRRPLQNSSRGSTSTLVLQPEHASKLNWTHADLAVSNSGREGQEPLPEHHRHVSRLLADAAGHDEVAHRFLPHRLGYRRLLLACQALLESLPKKLHVDILMLPELCSDHQLPCEAGAPFEPQQNELYPRLMRLMLYIQIYNHAKTDVWPHKAATGEACTERLTCPPMRRTRTRRSTRRFSYRRNPEALSPTRRLNSRCPFMFNQTNRYSRRTRLSRISVIGCQQRGLGKGSSQDHVKGTKLCSNRRSPAAAMPYSQHSKETKSWDAKKLQRARPCCRMPRACMHACMHALQA